MQLKFNYYQEGMGPSLEDHFYNSSMIGILQAFVSTVKD
jgi:hypothetical protein